MADVPTIQLLDGPPLRLPYRDRYPRLSGRRYIELRTSIARNGLLPELGCVLIDQHGNVLDGHHRLQCAKELGLFWPAVPVRRVEVRDEAHADELMRQANLTRRHLTDREYEERNARMRAKVEAGMSQRRVAAEEGVSQMTVSRAVQDETPVFHLECGASPDAGAAPASGRRRPNRQRGEDVRARIRPLLDAGKNSAEVAAALDMTPGNVHYHISRMRDVPPPSAESDKRRVARIRATQRRNREDEKRQAKEVARQLAAELKGDARRDAKDGWSLPAGKRGLLADLLVRIEAFPAGDPDIERAMAPVLKALAAVRRRFWPASGE